MRMSFTCVSASVLCLLLSAGSGAAQSHFVYSTVNGTFVTFTPAVDAIPCSQPGINNASQIAGAYTTSILGFPCHGFVQDGEAVSSFDYPGAYVTAARGINNDGQIVGTQCGGSAPNLPVCTAFEKNGNTFGSFDFPGALFTFANGLNNTGQIAGAYRVEIPAPNGGVQDVDHGLLIDHGVSSSLDFPGAVETQLNGINDAAAIVGSYRVNLATWPGFRWSGFLYQTSAWVAINYPGAILTFATAINNLNQVAGTYTDRYGFTHGFIKNGDRFSPFDVPGADTFVSGINDDGEVVGLAYLRPVADTLRALLTTVRGLGLPQGVQTNLVTKLKNAAAAFNNGEIDASCSKVQAFINVVDAQSGKKIPAASAEGLLAEAARLQAMIGCH
jgi:uncharacterized membrane protein